MGTGSEYERYEEPYSHEVRDRRVRGARGLQAVDGSPPAPPSTRRPSATWPATSAPAS